MKKFTRFEKLTGRIICIGSCGEDQIAWQETEDYGYIEGHHDGEQFYIVNNELVEKPTKPDDDHDWDAVKKKWKLNNERKKEKDDALFAAADKAAKEAQHEAEHEFIRELMKNGQSNRNTVKNIPGA